MQCVIRGDPSGAWYADDKLLLLSLKTETKTQISVMMRLWMRGTVLLMAIVHQAACQERFAPGVPPSPQGGAGIFNDFLVCQCYKQNKTKHACSAK